MAELSTEKIIHIAKLAGLSLTAKETTLYQKQLTKIIEYINQLNEVNTESVKPTSQTTGLENVNRKDIVKESLAKDAALSESNNLYKDYFKVPITLSQKEV